ncbi:MAG: hypothetical protein KME29_00555 [Calothrix sp. FI2-JRJ7]|nr:hypothetical protein [Calothrix sp. FI2-JRJ7]
MHFLMSALVSSLILVQSAPEWTTYSQPRLTSGDSTRCQIESLQNGNQVSMTVNTGASSQGSKKDSIKCRFEMSVEIEPVQGWYAQSIEHTINGGITKAPGGKALLNARSTFASKELLKIKETESNPLISRFQSFPITSVISKSKQCSNSFQGSTPKMTFELEAQTQGDASVSFGAVDINIVYAQCSS